MGKITSAIEKFQKEHIPPSVTKKSRDASVDVFSGTPDTSFEKDDALLSYNSFEKNLVTVLRPDTYEAEQFRMLRSHLLFPASGSPPKSMMVTSAVPGEGKSFVATNLAISIAQNIDQHVILVDCDIRKPGIHRAFGFGDMPGLSDYLSTDVPLSSLLLKTNIGKMTILPGGKPPHNPAELLSSTKMSELLSELSLRYNDRYIIIDTPPPKLTSETNVLARLVDGIILVIKHRSTKRKMVSQITDMFGKHKILGIVLNRYDLKSAAYGNHGYDPHRRYFQSSQEQSWTPSVSYQDQGLSSTAA